MYRRGLCYFVCLLFLCALLGGSRQPSACQTFQEGEVWDLEAAQFQPTIQVVYGTLYVHERLSFTPGEDAYFTATLRFDCQEIPGALTDYFGFNVLFMDFQRPKYSWYAQIVTSNDGKFSGKYSFGSPVSGGSGIFNAVRRSSSRPRVISGRVRLPVCANLAQPLTFDLRHLDGTLWRSAPVTLDSDGNFCLTDIKPQPFRLAIKGGKWLRKVVSIDTTSRDAILLDITLPPGDANNDNHTDILDLATLAEAFNSQPSDANWNANSDFNCDGSVNIYDLALLAEYFNQDGDL